uniref:Uncharacterized protein n=1 Tax=Tanacetum cinerariifolium TaxID=118510 RepID=A0A6L2NH26_TANCI|nr:hypothetical protein [Tanacetum cinerariifolium]
MQTQTSKALHNAIIEAGSKDRPPMLASGNYVQWKSRIKRYIDTKPNHELIHYCLKNPPYKYKWVDKEVQATEGGSVTTTESYMENYKNVSQDIRDQLNAKAEVVQIILTGIDNDIYSIIDACSNACEIGIGYDNQRIGNVAGARENVEVTLDAADNSGPIFDTEPVQQALGDKLKGEIEDFKTKNKSLEPSNNHFKEANNELSETNKMVYKDIKKFQAELDRQMKKELSAHQETISILTQQKEAQIKLYKTREDKELDKVIVLEKKVKVLDNIVYKTGQSVQTMNMLNRNYKTSFAKPEFLKKAQRANPHLYDIGCYNDNLALMLAPDSDEVIRLEKESRSKFHLCLNEKLVADLRYFNSLELEVDSLKSQLETQKTQFLNEIDRISREYYYADHMNAILGVYTELDKVTNLQCDYLEMLEKCECLEKELSKSKIISKSFETLQKHAINLELELQQCKENIKNDKSFKDKGIAISELKKLIETLKGKSVETKFEKSSVVRQPNVCKSQKSSVLEILLFIVDSGCSKHMTGNLKLLINFVEKFLGMMKFGNDQMSPILGYGDLVQGKVTIKRVYYVEGLNHNLFSVGKDLLTCSRGIDLYSITLQDTSSPNPICLMARATSSQAWLWHHRLSHLNFDTIKLLSKNHIVIGLLKVKFVKDHLYSSCELGKAK